MWRDEEDEDSLSHISHISDIYNDELRLNSLSRKFSLSPFEQEEKKILEEMTELNFEIDRFNYSSSYVDEETRRTEYDELIGKKLEITSSLSRVRKQQKEQQEREREEREKEYYNKNRIHFEIKNELHVFVKLLQDFLGRMNRAVSSRS